MNVLWIFEVICAFAVGFFAGMCYMAVLLRKRKEKPTFDNEYNTFEREKRN